MSNATTKPRGIPQPPPRNGDTPPVVAAPKQPPAPDTVLIEVPVGPLEGYQSTHVEVGRMTADQSAGLARLRIGLDRAGAKLKTGQRVIDNPSAVRWVLEQIGGPSE